MVCYSKYVVNPRDPLTLRYARTLDETRRDPYAWHEGNDDSIESRPFASVPPRRDAPQGFEARLQDALLMKQPKRPWLSAVKNILVRAHLSRRNF